MKIGKYDQKIQFVTEGRVSDGYGGTIPGDIVLLDTFAAIEQLKQSRNIEQAQMVLPATYRVGVQVRDGFNPEAGTLIKWRGKKYKIINTPVVESVRYNQQWTFDICQ